MAKYMIVGCVGAKSYFIQKDDKASDKLTNQCQSMLLDKLKQMRVSLNVAEEQKREATRSKSLQPIASTEYYKKLFEEFFIVGPDNEELKRFKVKETRHVRPKKVFQYPDNVPPEVR